MGEGIWQNYGNNVYILHVLCYERIMRDPLISMAMAMALFDEAASIKK